GQQPCAGGCERVQQRRPGGCRAQHHDGPVLQRRYGAHAAQLTGPCPLAAGSTTMPGMELLQPARPGLARLLLAAGACLLLAAAGCAGKRADQRLLHDTLYDYASAIRWGDLDAALSHVDPDYLRTHPLDSVERNRFQQLQVSGYYVKQS